MQVLMAAASKFERLNLYKGKDGKFIKGFLLNDLRNKNGWRTTWDSIKTCYTDFLNKPGTYFEDDYTPDHPAGTTYKDMMVNQENYRVVNIIDLELDEENHTLNYVGEILDNKLSEIDFEGLLESGKINHTSPGIFPTDSKVVGTMENGREMLDVYKWRAFHIAYIEDPAFGKSAAKTLGTCEGMGEQCMTRLAANTELTANTELAPLQEIPLIRKKLNAMYTPCQIKDFHKQILAAAEDEGGKWVTSKGQHIFIPDGEDIGDVINDHFEKLNDKPTKNKSDKDIEREDKEKEYNKLMERQEQQKKLDDYKKTQNPTNDSGIHDDNGRIKVSIDPTTATKEQIKTITEVWNDIQPSLKKEVFKLNIGTPPPGHEKAIGNYAHATNTLTLNLKGSNADEHLIKQVIHHELDHAKVLGMSNTDRHYEIKPYYEALPVDSYSKKYYDKLTEAKSEWEKSSKERFKVRDEMLALKEKGEKLDKSDPERIASVKIFREWRAKGAQKLQTNETKKGNLWGKAQTIYGLENHAAYTTMNDGLIGSTPNRENFMKLKEKLKNG